MYYEEQVIKGVLSYRSTPTGDWNPLTPEALTQRIMHLEKQRQYPFPIPQLPTLPVSPVPSVTPWQPPWIVTSTIKDVQNKRFHDES